MPCNAAISSLGLVAVQMRGFLGEQARETSVEGVK